MLDVEYRYLYYNRLVGFEVVPTQPGKALI
jgi:hypothetical protein